MLNLNHKSATQDITNFLSQKEEILFAYIFGSLLESKAPRDIDVAVYIDKDKTRDDLFDYEITLGAELEKNIKTDKPIDLIILNNAPKLFANKIYARGLCIFSKDDKLRTDIIEDCANFMFQNHFFSTQSLKELIN